MSENNITPHKKRGRKPKNYMNNNLANICSTINENINTEEEKIIYHIPLNLNEIENTSNTNTTDIFIKNHQSNNNINNNNSAVNDDDISLSGTDFNNSTIINNNINKISIHQIKCNSNTKCWWCKYSFQSVPVQLPENYLNNTFYCIGHFCSYNCAKSYNLDLNDLSTYKRNSLLHFLYNLSYSHYKTIVPAAHWLSLEDFGGILTIDKFRDNFIINNKEYIILHPPIISRQMQIEESYKINKLKEVPISKLNKIYSDIDSEYNIKRSKSYQDNNISLEETMGFIRK